MGASTEQHPWGRSEGPAKARPSVGWLVQTGGLLRCTTALGYPGTLDGSAALHRWLHKAIMPQLADNGGHVPQILVHGKPGAAHRARRVRGQLRNASCEAE
jgi:hypothetical protein